jgi:CRISPR/Cas system-associated endoribonuclease Cas2
VDILPPDYLDVNEPHINDIIMRHKTLTETNQDLIKIVQRNHDDIERMQKEVARLSKEKSDLILVFNSKLGAQQKYLDGLKHDVVYEEQKIEERDSTTRERMCLLSETKLAIDDLYDRCTKRSMLVVDQSRDEGVSSNVDKSWTEKLHTLQFRVLDLQGISNN